LLELKALNGKSGPSQMGVALQTNKMDLGLLEMQCTTLNPGFWPARVGDPSPACLPDTLSTCQPGPLAERLSVFSDLDPVKAHMHVQHKLGPKLKKVSNRQSTKCNTKN